jgi:hypothetical protein
MGGTSSTGGITSTRVDPGTGGAVTCFAQLRSELASAIEVSSCPSVCPSTTVTAVPAPARSASLGQRILLIDDGVVYDAATRYASRTLAFLRRSETGYYQEYFPSFAMPAEAYEILKKVDTAAPSPRSVDLDLAQAFVSKFPVFDGWIRHGTDIQAFLQDALPDAQFVVSEDQLELASPCGVLGTDSATAWQAYEGLFANMQATVVESIRKYDINFVHLSWGLEHESLVQQFQYDCGLTPDHAVTDRILGMYVDLFSAIAALQSHGSRGLQPVLVFQAGAASSSLQDSLLDCSDVPGRVRVYSAGYDGRAVPVGGSHDYSLLSSNEQAAMGCNDVYVVMGYTVDGWMTGVQRDEYFESLGMGCGLGPTSKPTWPPASSFANPVALAHFIYVTEQYPDESAESWLKRFTDSWTKPILDPLLHGQFPMPVRACESAKPGASD